MAWCLAEHRDNFTFYHHHSQYARSVSNRIVHAISLADQPSSDPLLKGKEGRPVLKAASLRNEYPKIKTGSHGTPNHTNQTLNVAEKCDLQRSSGNFTMKKAFFIVTAIMNYAESGFIACSYTLRCSCEASISSTGAYFGIPFVNL
jgi:hypothetical protein